MDKEQRYKELIETRNLRVVTHPCWSTDNNGDQIITDYCGMVVTSKQGTIEIFDTEYEAKEFLDSLYALEPSEGAKLLCERDKKAYEDLCKKQGWLDF